MPGKTTVMQRGRPALKLKGTDHRTIGLGGALNYPELEHGPNGKPTGLIILDKAAPHPGTNSASLPGKSRTATIPSSSRPADVHSKPLGHGVPPRTTQG
jgi:hypothetical protein